MTYSFDTEKIIANEDVVGIQFGDEHSVNPLADATTYHLIMTSRECMVVSMHNHPSLSLISVTDIRFFLQYGSIRLRELYMKTDSRRCGHAVRLCQISRLAVLFSQM